MANVVYMSKTGLTGGEATKLDSIDGAGLVVGDVAFVTVSNVQYIYKWAASTAAESSPDVIAADANGGDNRWLLQGITGKDLTISGLTASLPVFTDANKKLESKSVADTRTALGLGTADSPTFASPTVTGLTASGLTASLPVFTDGSKNLASKSIADTLTALGVGAWTDYSATSTILTFDPIDTKYIYYKTIEKIVFVKFYILGHSSGADFSFTLPTAAVGTTFAATFHVWDAGSPLDHIGYLRMTGTTVTLYKSQTAASTDWTDGGALKLSVGQFFYEIA